MSIEWDMKPEAQTLVNRCKMFLNWIRTVQKGYSLNAVAYLW